MHYYAAKNIFTVTNQTSNFPKYISIGMNVYSFVSR